MSFSRRTPDELEPNALTSLLGERRKAGRDICDLTVSNPTSVGLDYPLREIDAALASAGAGLYDPDPRGLLSARRAVCDYYAEHGREVDPEQVLLTASTSEAYAFLFKLLCDPGDEVLVPSPSYPLFDHLAAVEGVVARPYRLSVGREWAVDFASVEAALDERTRAILLVSPNNPTGSVVSPDELEELGVLARDRDLALICDEVFADYPTRTRASALLTEPRPAPPALRAGVLCQLEEVLGFSLGGLSKAAGMPQLKLGWIVITGPAPLRREALERLDLIADAFLSVCSIPQRALPDLLHVGRRLRARIAERVRAGRRAAENALGPGAAARLLPAAGGWYAIIELRERVDEEEVCLKLLAEHDVFVQPGYFFDIEGGHHLVVCLLAPTRDLERGLACLIELVEAR